MDIVIGPPIEPRQKPGRRKSLIRRKPSGKPKKALLEKARLPAGHRRATISGKIDISALQSRSRLGGESMEHWWKELVPKMEELYAEALAIIKSGKTETGMIVNYQTIARGIKAAIEVAAEMRASREMLAKATGEFGPGQSMGQVQLIIAPLSQGHDGSASSQSVEIDWEPSSN